MNMRENIINTMIQWVPVFPANTLVRTIADYIKSADQNFVPVSNDKTISGLIGKEKVLQNIGMQFGWSLYADKPLTVLMDPNPVIFDLSHDIDELLRTVVARPLSSVYDDIIVSKNGLYAGLLSVRQLMVYQIENNNRQLEALNLKHTLLQNSVASHLLDQKVDPEVWDKKVAAVIDAAQCIETLEKTAKNKSGQKNDIIMQGTIGIFSVIDLMQLLVQGGKTGKLEIHSQPGPYEITVSIYFDQGRIVHAAGAGETGHHSLWKSLRISEGSFSFIYGQSCDIVSIHENPMHLLIEACRKQDEENALLNATEKALQ